jgi:hypothetical protein
MRGWMEGWMEGKGGGGGRRVGGVGDVTLSNFFSIDIIIFIFGYVNVSGCSANETRALSPRLLLTVQCPETPEIIPPRSRA